MKYKALLISSWLLFFSCTEDVPVELPPFEEKLVVEGYLVAGDTIVIRLDKTVNPYFGDHSRQNPYRLPKNALVRIWVNDSIFQLSERAEFTLGRSGIVYTSGSIIQSDLKYRVTAEYQGLRAEGECRILPQTKLKDVELNATFESKVSGNTRKNKSTYNLALTAEFPPELAYYLLSLSAANSVGNYETVLTVPFQTNAAQGLNPFLFENLISYKFSYLPKQYVVSLYRIERIYYEFLKAVEAQQGEYDSFLATETTEIPTNIIGGYGIFTGMSKDTMSVELF